MSDFLNSPEAAGLDPEIAAAMSVDEDPNSYNPFLTAPESESEDDYMELDDFPASAEGEADSLADESTDTVDMTAMILDPEAVDPDSLHAAIDADSSDDDDKTAITHDVLNGDDDPDAVSLVKPAETSGPLTTTGDEYVDAVTRRIAREQREAKLLAANDDALGSLLSAWKQNRAVEICISAVSLTVLTTEAGPQKVPCWVSYVGGTKILIPIYDAYEHLPHDLYHKGMHSDRSIRASQISYMDNAIGAKIRVCITGITASGDSGIIAMASRVEAMRRLRTRFFGNKAVTPVKEGMIVTATVLACGEHRLHVMCCGTDCSVEIRHLTHRYVPSLKKNNFGSSVRNNRFLQEITIPGNTVLFRVSRISTYPDGSPRLFLNRRSIEMEQDFIPLLKRSRIRFEQDHTDRVAHVCAISSQIRRDGTIQPVASLFVYTDLDNGEGVPGFARGFQLFNNGVRMRVGNLVVFRASGVTDDGYLHGNIVRNL